MIVTVEISLYPLEENFEAHIIGFIQSLKTYPELIVISNAMSTQVKGEWKQVMAILTEELGVIYDKIDTSSTVLKIINRALPIEEVSLEF